MGSLFGCEGFGTLLDPPLVSVNRKERSWQDPVAKQVIRAHMWLQEEGNFSTWTLSGRLLWTASYLKILQLFAQPGPLEKVQSG